MQERLSGHDLRKRNILIPEKKNLFLLKPLDPEGKRPVGSLYRGNDWMFGEHPETVRP